MSRDKYSSIQQVARVVRDALGRGATVEIDGLGSFCKTQRGYRFQPCNLPRIFIAYVREDTLKAEKLFQDLVAAGFDPWMDRRKLLPGQNWPRAIQNAMETSHLAIGCFSASSICKRGGFQAEIRYALECARRLPLDEVFLLPVRLEECLLPLEVARHTQYVDLFPDWDTGVEQLIRAIRRQAPKSRIA